MPKYRITAPDGHTLEITAPDGASQADVLAYAQKNYQPTAAPANGQDQGAGGAFLHGLANTATFGLADKGLALMESGLSHITPGPNESYGDALQNVQRTQGATAEAHPIANIAGDVAGAVGTGSALERGAVAAASRVAPNAVNAAREALTLRRGQTAANLARLSARGAGTGALFGGAQGAVDGAGNDGVTGAVEQGAEGAGLGAAVGAVTGPLGAAIPKAASAVKTAFSGVSQRAIKVLADKLDETPQRLMTMISDFRNSTGRAPSIAEILGAKSIANVSDIPANYQEAGLSAQSAADANVQTLPKRLSAQVAGTGDTSNTNLLRTQQDAVMTNAMKPIRQAPVVVHADDLDLLNDPRVRSVVRSDPELRGKYDEMLDTLTDPEGQPISGALSDALNINDFENLRLSLRGKQQAFSNPNSSAYNPVRAKQFGKLADDISRYAGKQVPEYGDALEQYARHERFIQGFDHAAAGKDVSAVSDMGDIRTLNSPEARMGLEVGARSRLVQQAGSSESGAVRTANEMRQDAGLSDRLNQQMGGRARPLRRIGEFEATATRNLNSLAPNNVVSKHTETSRASSQLLETAAATVGKTLTGFKTHVLARLLTGSQLRPSTANKIVAMLVDPNQRDTAIRMLGNARVSQQKLYRILQSAAQASGIVGGSAAAGTVNTLNGGGQ